MFDRFYRRLHSFSLSVRSPRTSSSCTSLFVATFPRPTLRFIIDIVLALLKCFYRWWLSAWVQSLYSPTSAPPLSLSLSLSLSVSSKLSAPKSKTNDEKVLGQRWKIMIRVANWRNGDGRRACLSDQTLSTMRLRKVQDCSVRHDLFEYNSHPKPLSTVPLRFHFFSRSCIYVKIWTFIWTKFTKN